MTTSKEQPIGGETVEWVHGTFLGLEPAMSSYDRARVVIVQAPYDGTASYSPGARHGPAAILAASVQVEPFDHELGRCPSALGVHTIPSFLPDVRGPEHVVAQVRSICERPVRDGKFVFLLGGEHSVTTGAVEALCGQQQRAISFLQIDAHLDLRDSYEGSRHSHACAGRRMLEHGRVVHVGARTACDEEMAVVRNAGLDPIWGREVHEQPDDQWIRRAVDQLSDEVYVSLDVDGLDPSVIPGTGTPVPGGLGWYQVLRLLEAVGSQRKVVGCDVVELAPAIGDHRSAFAAALLVHKMIGYLATSQTDYATASQ